MGRLAAHTYTLTLLKELGRKRCKKCDAVPVTDMVTSPIREKRVAAAGGCGVGGPNEGREEKKHKTCFG